MAAQTGPDSAATEWSRASGAVAPFVAAESYFFFKAAPSKVVTMARIRPFPVM
jgi:hypothetical protein